MSTQLVHYRGNLTLLTRELYIKYFPIPRYIRIVFKE